MASKVHKYDKLEHFKIARLNLQKKTKDCHKKLKPPPVDWNEIKVRMQQKFKDVDLDELKMKMDMVKQKLRQRVQLYFDKLDKMFRKGKINLIQNNNVGFLPIYI